MCKKQKTVSVPASYCHHLLLGVWIAKSSRNSIGLPQGFPQGLKGFFRVQGV